jgi:tetratricopeptide (TPR) repeat protein
MRNSFIRILITGVVILLVAVILFKVPPIHSRLAWRIDNARAGIKYALNPPDEAVFVPAQQASQFTPTPAPSSTPVPTLAGPTSTLAPSAVPTVTPTAVPAAVTLPGIIYVDQHNRWNYCEIANLAMALKFWGWKGEEGNTLDLRDQIAAVVKPGQDDPSLDLITRGKSDKNVMPYELADYVANHTDYSIAVRYGGDLQLLKQLIAAGFPAVVEKGYFERDSSGKVTWMGHALFTTGYDDSQGTFTVQDSYLTPGKNMKVKYQDYLDGWRSFDYLFYVVYPLEREAEVYSVLGDWGDPNLANQYALDLADDEIETQAGINEFFAWFNKGTSEVNLLQYGEAAQSYDKAFEIYATLDSDELKRPYRMMWYQTGPYKAYYYSGRYQDVIDLANTTLYSTISTPDLEESLYWKALAEDALGDHDAAVSDLRSALYLNHNFAAAYDALAQMGATP